ncbi:MAG: hypothetical protein Q7J27_07855 [Syntrophales bacterium]|nr:hypothetical protein [Syntrophales bacterium]
MRSLLNNIGGILIILLFLAVLIYLPNIISSVTDRGLGEAGQKIRSFLSTHGSQMQPRGVKGTSRKGEDAQEQQENCNKAEKDGSFPDFYVVPRSLSENKDGKKEPFSGFYVGGRN